MTTITASRKTTRPRGYRTDYQPQAATLDLLTDARAVLTQYEDQLPLTIRQIYYVLIGTGKYHKGEQFENRLYEAMNSFRRARLIPFEAVRDDGIAQTLPDHFADEDDFYEYCRLLGQNYKRDKLAGQQLHIEVWCEAAGMVPQLATVAHRYSVPVYSGGGFDSLTAKWGAAQRLCRESRQAVIIHLGDYDPSGDHLFSSVDEDVSAFVAVDRPHGLVSVTFRRLALTSAQIRALNLPTEAVKPTTTINRNWLAARQAAGEVDEACQLEALPPDTLAALLDSAIRTQLDPDQLAADHALERQDRRRITTYLLAPPSTEDQS